MDATYAQTSFLGGEISKWAQGQFDRPNYKKSLARAFNIIITDEGAAVRRPGTRFLGTPRGGQPSCLLPFDFSESSPYNMEFTDNYLRFWNGESLVTSNDSLVVQSISNASPAVFTLGTAVAWATGDQVYFTFDNPAQAVAGAVLLNRQFTLTMLSTTTFTVVDAVTGAEIDASMFNIPTVNTNVFIGAVSSAPISSYPVSGASAKSVVIRNLSARVNRIADIGTPYAVAGADWHSLRSVQGLDLAVLLQGQVAPRALQVIADPTDTSFAVFSFGAAAFQDGPYLDPPANAVATPSALSGLIQVTVGYAAWVSGTVYGAGVPVTYGGEDYTSLVNGNTGNTPVAGSSFWRQIPLGSSISSSGFVATDVGRMMRLFSAPQAWSSATTYAAGNTVSYNGSYFTSQINANTNNQPDISLNDWTLNPSGARWVWGVVTAVLAANSVRLQLQSGTNLLYTTACPLFRIGAWSDTTGWPTSGCYQGGRFWFGGAIPNRLDSSQPDAPFTMSPTQPDGTVTDSNGISYTFNSNSVDQILWMEPQAQGVLVGTQKGEYLLSSGTSNGPITPSSIAESPATKYGSANVLPVKTGLTMCFVQRYKRRLLEYLSDVFSQRFYGPDLTTYVRHLGTRSFEQLAYQQVPVPIVWARMGDGSVTGITYRRASMFSNQEPEFSAWHQHAFGSGRLIESICVGPSTGGTLDTLSLISNDPANNVRFVTSMTPMRDETDPLTLAWFLDSGVTPVAATLTDTSVIFYGLSHLNGRRASVFAAALDCGDYLVENGQVTVPLGTKDTISGYTFDIAQFNLLQPRAAEFSEMSTLIVGSDAQYQIPCVIGFNYQSQGKLCRPMLPADTGSRNGPGFAKKRRNNRYGIYLVESLGVQVGTDFDKMISVPAVSPTGRLLPYLTALTGIKRETIPDDLSFDGMLCWQTTRPFPAVVVAYGGFIETQDV